MDQESNKTKKKMIDEILEKYLPKENYEDLDNDPIINLMFSETEQETVVKDTTKEKVKKKNTPKGEIISVPAESPSFIHNEIKETSSKSKSKRKGIDNTKRSKKGTRIEEKRPSKKNNGTPKKNIVVSFTEEQYKKIEKDCQELGLSKSTYVRAIFLKREADIARKLKAVPVEKIVVKKVSFDEKDHDAFNNIYKEMAELKKHLIEVSSNVNDNLKPLKDLQKKLVTNKLYEDEKDYDECSRGV